jgi:hypothetical protein
VKKPWVQLSEQDKLTEEEEKTAAAEAIKYFKE